MAQLCHLPVGTEDKQQKFCKDNQSPGQNLKHEYNKVTELTTHL